MGAFQLRGLTTSGAPAAASPLSSTRKGLALALGGGFILSFDIPTLRLGGGEEWSVMALRSSLIALVGLSLWALARARGRLAPLVPGRSGALVMLLYGLNGVTFTLAIYNTSTANVVFIIALNPMLTALLSWWLNGERPRTATWIALTATTAGVTLIVADGLSTGNWIGDAYAFATSVLLALSLTLTRRDDLDIGLGVLAAAAIPATLAWIVVARTGADFGDWRWIAVDGMLVMPLAFLCLSTAPRYVPAAIAAMAFLIETTLAPVWVWLIIDERPTDAVLLGGAIVLSAVLLHAGWQAREGRARHA